MAKVLFQWLVPTILVLVSKSYPYIVLLVTVLFNTLLSTYYTKNNFRQTLTESLASLNEMRGQLEFKRD